MSDTERLTENERAIALMVAKREDGETRKWLNLVLKAYDAVEAERAGLAETISVLTDADAMSDLLATERELRAAAEAARAGLETALREIATSDHVQSMLMDGSCVGATLRVHQSGVPIEIVNCAACFAAAALAGVAGAADKPEGEP